MNPTPDDHDDLQNRFDHLLEIAIEQANKINGEWGTGSVTDDQLRQEILDELQARIIHARSGL